MSNERDSTQKPFSATQRTHQGKSTRDLYMSDPDYKEDHQRYEQCRQFAEAYSGILLRRAEVEDPAIFAVKGMSKEEMHLQMIQNMCLPYAHQKALSFRDATAKINEKRYLNDEIRRLTQGGERFHPYL